MAGFKRKSLLFKNFQISIEWFSFFANDMYPIIEFVAYGTYVLISLFSIAILHFAVYIIFKNPLNFFYSIYIFMIYFLKLCNFVTSFLSFISKLSFCVSISFTRFAKLTHCVPSRFLANCIAQLVQKQLKSVPVAAIIVAVFTAH